MNDCIQLGKLTNTMAEPENRELNLCSVRMVENLTKLRANVSQR